MGRLPLSAKRGNDLVSLVATIIVLAGVANAVQGLAAVAGAEQLARDLRIPSLDTSGWTFVALGVVQAFAGVAVLLGSRVAQLGAIALAVASALTQLAQVGDHQAWSIAVIVLDAIIVLVLVTRGGAFARDRGMVDLFYAEAREGAASVEYVSDPDGSRTSAMAATGRPLN